MLILSISLSQQQPKKNENKILFEQVQYTQWMFIYRLMSSIYLIFLIRFRIRLFQVYCVCVVSFIFANDRSVLIIMKSLTPNDRRWIVCVWDDGVMLPINDVYLNLNILWQTPFKLFQLDENDYDDDSKNSIATPTNAQTHACQEKIRIFRNSIYQSREDSHFISRRKIRHLTGGNRYKYKKISVV